MENVIQTAYNFIISLAPARQTALFIGAGVALLFVALLFYGIGRKIGRLEVLRGQDKLLRAERADAVKRSRAVIGGQLVEQVAPYLPDFPCSPEDVRFIGKPVDFIGFSGMCSGDTTGDGAAGEISEILFIEIKTGGSQLSEREKQIKKAIDRKRVRYVVVNK